MSGDVDSCPGVAVEESDGIIVVVIILLFFLVLLRTNECEMTL